MKYIPMPHTIIKGTPFSMNIKPFTGIKSISIGHIIYAIRIIYMYVKIIYLEFTIVEIF